MIYLTLKKCSFTSLPVFCFNVHILRPGFRIRIRRIRMFLPCPDPDPDPGKKVRK